MTETEVFIPGVFKDAEQYFSFMNEVAAPVVAGMAKADEVTRARIKDAVFRRVAERTKGGEIRLDAMAVVITGER